MKRIIALVIILATLNGCSFPDSGLDAAMKLREQALRASNCSFQTTVTADYSEKLYTFGMLCTFDGKGDMTFEVIQPETISGIKGSVSNEGGKLTFDDKALLFEPLIDGLISPVSAPWVFYRTLLGGYINGCSESENGYYIQFDDSYKDDSLQLNLWTDRDVVPCDLEIIWQGRRILSMKIENFTFL